MIYTHRCTECSLVRCNTENAICDECFRNKLLNGQDPRGDLLKMLTADLEKALVAENPGKAFIDSVNAHTHKVTVTLVMHDGEHIPLSPTDLSDL